jgi:hypothetical protein
MKFLLQIICFYLVTVQFCSAQWMPAESDSVIHQVVSQINTDSLQHCLRVLTGADSVTIGGSSYLIRSRNNEQPGNNIAADYIVQTLSQTGLSVYDDQYNLLGRNIYAIQTGTDFPDQEYIICAHYDDMPAGSIAPGADDNASGTAAVLEAARVISQFQPRYTIIYALWDQEELGLIGSRYYAETAYLAGENILGVVNLDMLGWETGGDYSFMIHSSYVGDSFGLARLGSALANYISPGLYPLFITHGASNSDHSCFWEKGYSAIEIAEDLNDFNPYYHTTNDNLNHFNYNYYFNLAKVFGAEILFLGINGLGAGNLDSPLSSVDKTYARPGIDSVLFRITFPNFDPEENFDAHLLYGPPFEPVTDSLLLFDDGMHEDSLAGDGIFAVFIPPQSTEGLFLPSVSTTDQNTNEYHCITQWVLFTTAGPVIIDTLTINRVSPDHYIASVTVKNVSSASTIVYSMLELSSTDSWVQSISPKTIVLPDLAPGSTATVSFSIQTTDTLAHELFTTVSDILSSGFPSWTYTRQDPVTTTGIADVSIRKLRFSLDQNYPNPFNPATTIRYSLPKASKVQIKIFDVLGNEIGTLVNADKPAGTYEIDWNAAKLPGGVYFYQLRAGEFVQTKKMILLK